MENRRDWVSSIIHNLSKNINNNTHFIAQIEKLSVTKKDNRKQKIS